MMTSCWGFSIRRPKVIKHKFVKNINEYIDTYAPFIIKYKFNDDAVSGFVDSINPFVPHFTVPQFARSVLNEFKSMMDEIKKIVTVYYENIDAILINESDYNKLMSLGYIGNELGKFKIEQVFTEIAIKNQRSQRSIACASKTQERSGQRQYVATLETGEKYYHCVKDVDYDSFVQLCCGAHAMKAISEVKNN